MTKTKAMGDIHNSADVLPSRVTQALNDSHTYKTETTKEVNQLFNLSPSPLLLQSKKMTIMMFYGLFVFRSYGEIVSVQEDIYVYILKLASAESNKSRITTKGSLPGNIRISSS